MESMRAQAFFPHTQLPHNLIHNNENLISYILKVSAHLWSHFNKNHSQHLI